MLTKVVDTVFSRLSPSLRWRRQLTATAVNMTRPAVAAVSQRVKTAWNTSEEYLRTAAPRVVELAAAAADQARPAVSQVGGGGGQSIHTVCPYGVNNCFPSGGKVLAPDEE